MELKEIPVHIDEPAQFLMWYLDEVIAMSTSFMVGIITNHLTYGIIGSVIIAKAYRRFRDGHQTNFLQHWLYWRGFYPSNAYSMPNPFIRKWG